MSSTYKSPSTVDAQAHSSREHADDLGLNNNHLPNTSFEQSHLSPYYSHTVSNNTSPYNIESTPGESISEFSNYQPSEYSEIEDPFFGVDFSDGVQRIDSLPIAILGNIAYQVAPTNPHQQGQEEQAEPKSASDTLTTSTYPLSPRHTSIANTPSPRSDVNDLKAKTTISQHELTTELHNSRTPAFSLAPTNSTAHQLTPDHSGSSHTSAEGLKPSTMARHEHSPHLMVSQWGNEQSQTQPHTFAQPSEQCDSATHIATDCGQFPAHQAAVIPQGSGPPDDEGSWRAGLAPDSRTDVEVPNLKQQEEQRRIDIRNEEVQEWRSQAGGSDEEDTTGSYFDVTLAVPRQPRDPDETYNNILQVDDAASIHENRLQDGQFYYNLKSVPNPEVDGQIMSRPRHWNDGPSLPNMTVTIQQPPTSNDAIRKWNASADTISITSRAATWGTQRRRASEPSLLEYDALFDGSFFKKLSIKPRENERRQPSIFDQGLERITSMVRKRSDAKLKRARSSQNIPQEDQNATHPRNNSHGTLAPPGRTPSFGRRPTPSINTAIGAMTGSIGAVGNPHTRSGSIGGAPTSPKSPTHLGFARSARSVINRVRSRSELTSQDRVAQAGLVDLWKGQGGPPVANLATSPPLETDVRPPQQRPKPKPKPQAQPEVLDLDEDEDEDDDAFDNGDMKIEPESQFEPIVPNYEGFKAHVKRLNTEMDPRYNWLVSRIAHQQEIRYKSLLDQRVKHLQAIMNRNCGAGRHCMSLGGNATLLDAKGHPRDSEHTTSGLHLQTDFSDDSNPGEGAITDETFPQGVPMPPTRNLPAEFECQLCFKAKKFQKPSDWTKHVHEDVQPFTCTYDKCKEPKSFKRKADWVRHENERHRHLEWWICQVDDCRHPCYRKDNFLQHLVREHKLPEPKQKTKAAIKKARGTEPAWIMLEQCHHETSNKPQDEPCKFCGKSFNTWKKLTVHLAKHMEHISLPILRLVELRNVDANTIISPVEPILTPITPISRGKMESASPFNIDSVSPHVPMVQQFPSGYDQSNFYQAPSPARGYGMQAPHEVTYDQNSMYSNTYGAHPMEQPRGFISMGDNGLNMNQARQFGSVDSGFPQPKMEQPRQFGSVDSAFSMPEHNYNLQQTSGLTMPQNFASAPPVTSGYQAPNMLGISQAGFDFNPMSVNGGQPFQQVPMSRAQGSASSYGHSPQNVPNYYGHQS